MFEAKPGLKHKMNFFRLMSVSQKAGLAVRDSLMAIRFSEKNRGMYKILTDMILGLGKGHTLAESMEPHSNFFTTSEIEIVRSAEMSGNMIDTLQDLYLQIEDTNKMIGKVKKAMTYPVILVVFTFIAIVVLLVEVVPSIVSLFPSQDQLPEITLFVLSWSGFFQEYWLVILLTVVGIVVGFKFLYSNVLGFKKGIDSFLLKVPVLKEAIMYFYIYRFSILLGQFYKAGLNPVVSLGLIANIFDNYEYKIKMLKIKNDISGGFSFFESMEGSTLFDPILIQILHVGEETGTIGDTMSNISGYYKDTLDGKIDAFMSMLEPILIACAAVVIGVIIASVFMPMTSLVGVIG